MSKQQQISIFLSPIQVAQACEQYARGMFDSSYDIEVAPAKEMAVKITRKRVRKPAKPKVVAAKAAA